MPGLDPAVHRCRPDQEPYKQPPWRMRQELEDQVCVEVSVADVMLDSHPGVSWINLDC
jgi:hypothetical protein